MATSLVLFGTGCGAALSGAQFDGWSHPQTRSADQIEELYELPANYERIGRVEAHCTEASGDLHWTDILFTDVTQPQRQRSAEQIARGAQDRPG